MAQDFNQWQEADQHQSDRSQRSEEAGTWYRLSYPLRERRQGELQDAADHDAPNPDRPGPVGRIHLAQPHLLALQEGGSQNEQHDPEG